LSKAELKRRQFGYVGHASPLRPSASAPLRAKWEYAMRANAMRGAEFDRDVVMECEDNLAFMRRLHAGSMQLIVTSPPYNIGKSYEARTRLDDYVASQDQVIAECVRLLNLRGSLCWQIGNHVQNGEIFPLDIVLYPLFQRHGLKLRNRIIWHFEHGLHCSKRLSGRYETIMWFTKGNDYSFNLDPIRVPSKYPGKKYFKGPKIGQLSGNPLGKNPGDVWIFPNVKNNHVEKTIHPCQFPVELVERLVLSLTKTGDAVFDPYMGVGSTVIAAMKNDRVGYGCDVVKQYVEIAWQRVAAFRSGGLQTRPMAKAVYDPSKPYGGHRIVRRRQLDSPELPLVAGE
jgi:adenine-specific DNA-methyltransferase